MSDVSGIQAQKSMISRPVLWILGLYAGSVVFLTIMLVYFQTLFIATRIFILLCVLFPFFVAGTLASLRDEHVSVTRYLLYAKQYYFSVLLPAILILFISVLVMMIVGSFLAIAGGITLFAGLLTGIGVLFVFGLWYSTIFYDVIAIRAKKKVLESIRASITLVMERPLPVLAMVIVLVLIGIAIGIVCMVLFSIALDDAFSPYIGMDANEIEETFSAMSASDWIQFLGMYGFLVTAIIGGFGTCLFTMFYYSYRYRWYQMLTKREEVLPDKTDPAPAPIQGEYDDKGRWYKY